MKTKVLFLLCFAIQQLTAQDIVTAPLTNNVEIQAYRASVGDNLRPNKQNAVFLELPFIDDFSYDGVYPDPSKWVDRDVFRNNTMAINPPSFGVVTFDGVDESGAPYGESNETSDFLTSQNIDLSNYVISDKNIFLSFFVQPGGIGEPPVFVEGLENENLVIEFKDENGMWVNMLEIISPNENNNQVLPENSIFTYYSISIENNENTNFLHSAFQFRFYNNSSNFGLVDVWHLDYVVVDEYNTAPNGSMNDVAFTTPITSLLKNYYSMPWEQFDDFEEQELTDFIEVGVYNHFSEEVNQPTLNTQMDFTELNTETALVPDDYVWLGANETSILPNSLRVTPIFINEDPVIRNNIMNLNIENNSANLQLDLSFNPINEDTNPIFMQNNSLSGNTILSNYYAYDDGIADGVFTVNGTDIIAVKYHTNKPTTLHAVQMYHGRNTKFAGSKPRLFSLYVWIGELDNDPELSLDNFNAPTNSLLNQYTTYVLKDINSNDLHPISIPEGTDFYVAWRQEDDCHNGDNKCVVVGTDNNKPEAYDNIFRGDVNLGSTIDWESLSSIVPRKFALMVRPIVGNGFVNNLSIDIVEEHTHCNLEVGGDKVVIDVSIGVEDNFSLETCGAITKFHTTIQGVGSGDDKAHYSPITGLYHGKACFGFADFADGYGDYVLEIYAENGCGTVSDEIIISIVPPVLLEENEVVCNNTTTGTIEHVNAETYSAISLHSGGVDFCSPGGDVLVKSSTIVEYVAKEFIKLYPGFHAASDSYFHAYIDELLEDDCDDNFQNDDNDTKLLTVNDDSTSISSNELIPKAFSADETALQNRLEIFPNPSHQHITVQYAIELEPVKNVELAIFNMQGQQITSTKQISTLNQGVYQEQIDLKDYPSGIYFCQLSCDQFRWVRKMTKM